MSCHSSATNKKTQNEKHKRRKIKKTLLWADAPAFYPTDWRVDEEEQSTVGSYERD